MPTPALILAAGASTRLGHPKQLALLNGEPLLTRALRTAQEAGLSPILIVLGANAPQIQTTCQLKAGQVIENKNWQQGMSTSLIAGIQALGPFPGVVLMTCDQPAVTAGHLRKLTEHGTETGQAIASSYGERHGVPAYFPGTRFAEVLLLTGDAGAKSLLASAISIPLVLGELDIDTPDALQQARKIFSEGTRV